VTDYLEVLGIAPDAGLQDIKRAYARALKSNRPDDDPEAFARVHAAFEACVARFKRLEAGIEDEPVWSDDEDYDDLAPVAFHDVGSVASAEVRPPLDAAGARVHQVVEEIFLQAVESKLAQDFHAWLRADERLYDLAFKRDVGDVVVSRLSEEAHSLGWRRIAAIYEFFEVDSISDPRLRRDPDARQLWLRVEADARFDEAIKAQRGAYADFAERTVMAELLDPPDRLRSLKMHLIPMLPGQLRGKYNELHAKDPQRAEAAISPHAREYWLPRSDPGRLHPRRVALALMHSVLVGLPVGFLIYADRSARQSLNISAGLAGIIFSIWLLGALVKFSGARYSAWRLRTVGAGEVPAGANPLADRVTAFGGSAAVLSLAIAIVALRVDKAELGIIFQVWMLMAMIVVFRASRWRWEAASASVAIAACVYPYLGRLADATAKDAFFAIGSGSFAIGVLAVLLIDAIHGRQSRQALVDVRDAVSIPLCVVTATGALFAWFY
jgi:hypothetical protein